MPTCQDMFFQDAVSDVELRMGRMPMGLTRVSYYAVPAALLSLHDA